ncbi:MAG TPA: hypothetical protein VGH19_13295 [Verrucomicrobiae bacterium]
MSPAAPIIKRRWLIVFTIFLLLAAIFWWSRSGPTELDRYKAQLIAQGEILDLDKLAPKRTGTEPDGDEPMRQTVRQLTNDLVPKSLWFMFTTTNGVQKIEWNYITGQHHSNTLTRIQNGVAEIENKRHSLLVLHHGLTNLPAEKGGDYRQILNHPKINFVQRRTISQFLHHAIVLDAYAGRYGDAFTNLLTSLRLAQHHREEWTLVNQMVRTAVVRLPLEDLNYGLALHAWDDAQLAELHAHIAPISLVTNVYQALLYERAVGLAFFAEARRDAHSAATNAYFVPYSYNWKRRLHTTLWSHFAIDEDELNFLKISQQRLDLIRPNLISPNWAGVPDQLRSDWETLFRPATTYSSQLKLNFTGALYSSMDSGLTTLLFAEACRQQAIAAIALERHWLKHRRYPDALEKLMPDYLSQLPLDPIDGRPMRYRLNVDGTYTLWSIGFDGKDNQGDPFNPDPQKHNSLKKTRDFVWPRINPTDLPQ